MDRTLEERIAGVGEVFERLPEETRGSRGYDYRQKRDQFLSDCLDFEEMFKIILDLQEENKKFKSKLDLAMKLIGEFKVPEHLHETGFINFHCPICGHEPKRFDDAARSALEQLK